MQDILEFLHTKQQTDAITNKPPTSAPNPSPVPAGGINSSQNDIAANGAQTGQRGGAHQRYCHRGGRQNCGLEAGAGGTGEFIPGQFQGGSGSNSSNRNSGERKPLFCVYCCKSNHQQERCLPELRTNCLVSNGTENNIFLNSRTTNNSLKSQVMRARANCTWFFSCRLNDSSH